MRTRSCQKDCSNIYTCLWHNVSYRYADTKRSHSTFFSETWNPTLPVEHFLSFSRFFSHTLTQFLCLFWLFPIYSTCLLLYDYQRDVVWLRWHYSFGPLWSPQTYNNSIKMSFRLSKHSYNAAWPISKLLPLYIT